MIDDIMDSGATICCAANALIKQGAASVSAFVSHGVFSGDYLHHINQIHWQQFWVTDTICQVDLPEVIQVASVAKSIAMLC